MRTAKIFTLLLLSGSMFFGMGSCKKEDNNATDTTDSDMVAAENNAQAEKIFTDAYNMIDYTARTNEALYKNNAEQEEMLGACATVSHDTTASPHKVTVDFGAGCTGNDGRTRSGKVIGTYTGRYRNKGTVITITFDNYVVDGYSVEGAKTIENLGNNTAGNLTFKITVTGGKISGNGMTHTWSSSRENEWISGANTLTWTDDAYLITGGSIGTNKNGLDYATTITNAIKVQAGCRWITQGTIEIKPVGKLTRTVDYGNGTCDATATVTISKKTYTFTMR